MLIQFVFLNLLLISIGAILFIFIRTLPRLEDNEFVKQGVFERWLTSQFPEKLDQFFSTLFMRTLRRTKVLILKADNALNRKIESLKLERGGDLKGPGRPVEQSKQDIQQLSKDESIMEEESVSD